ncbi:MAG: hypothetical protein AAF432_14285, partial [Planctomycetota bacterium]
MNTNTLFAHVGCLALLSAGLVGCSSKQDASSMSMASSSMTSTSSSDRGDVNPSATSESSATSMTSNLSREQQQLLQVLESSSRSEADRLQALEQLESQLDADLIEPIASTLPGNWDEVTFRTISLLGQQGDADAASSLEYCLLSLYEDTPDSPT